MDLILFDRARNVHKQNLHNEQLVGDLNWLNEKLICVGNHKALIVEIEKGVDDMPERSYSPERDKVRQFPGKCTHKPTMPYPADPPTTDPPVDPTDCLAGRIIHTEQDDLHPLYIATGTPMPSQEPRRPSTILAQT